MLRILRRLAFGCPLGAESRGIFRVFRFFRPLARLALMIMDSIRSLLWAMFMPLCAASQLKHRFRGQVGTHHLCLRGELDLPGVHLAHGAGG